MKKFKSGYREQGYKYSYFIPNCINHAFLWDNDAIDALLEKASIKLGELNSFSRFVPNRLGCIYWNKLLFQVALRVRKRISKRPLMKCNPLEPINQSERLQKFYRICGWILKWYQKRLISRKWKSKKCNSIYFSKNSTFGLF